MPSTQATTSSTSPSRITRRLQGKVSFPSDERYNEARKAWNLVVDQHPAMIVYVENPLDVIEAVTFANQHNLSIAVQSTGHGLKRPADGAMLINTSRMKELRLDPRSQTAWIGAGVKWGEVLEITQQFGLAPLVGSSPDVGAVGYTLGGGFGWLARKYGLSVDSVIGLDVVTPDGVFRRASLDENSDLFWALRGGGGGFGVVTSMQIRLHRVTQVYAGSLFYPPNMAESAFRHFRQWVDGVPDELTASIVLMNFPSLPQIPAQVRGLSFVIVRGCYAGPVKDGQAVMAYWRDWQKPAIDDFKAMPFSHSAEISRDPLDPGPYPMTGAWLRDLSEDSADVLIKHTFPHNGPPLVTFSEIRLAGGAIARVDPGANAYSNRGERFLWSSVGRAADSNALKLIREHFDQMHTALAPYLSGKVMMNFLDGDEARRRTRDGVSEQAFRRLQAVKARYDPNNTFDYAFDIPPAKE